MHSSIKICISWTSAQPQANRCRAKGYPSGCASSLNATCIPGANIGYQEQSPGKPSGHSSSPGQGTRHARTARALSTPPSGAPRLSATNPTVASRSRTPQNAKPTTCANMDSTDRMTTSISREEVIAQEWLIQAGS